MHWKKETLATIIYDIGINMCVLCFVSLNTKLGCESRMIYIAIVFYFSLSRVLL